MSGFSGGDVGAGMLAGAFGSMASAAVGGIFKGASKFAQGAAMIGAGGLSGGVGSVLAGGDFWDGARNGLISAGLNHVAHSIQKTIQNAKKAGIIFIDNLTEGLDVEKYMTILKDHLILNGFSFDLEIAKYSFWKELGAKLVGRPIAHVTIIDRYIRGAPLEKGVGGYAKLGSNSAVVYGKGMVLGKVYNPSILDLVYITTHELGHAIFSFGHTSTGVMFWRYGGGTGNPYMYNENQIQIIEQSQWGQ